MATNYPSGLDTYTNPAGTDALSTGHASQHANVNDAVEAIEAELGTTPSGSAATVKARFEAIETNDWVTTARIANSQVTSAKIADATITGSDIATGTVTSTNILDATITGTDIASGTVTSTNILDGTIVNADINASAAIDATKLSGVVAASLVDAKGDLLTATADNTPARLAVGADGVPLRADSSASTGLAWPRDRLANPVGNFFYLDTYSQSADLTALQGYQFCWPVFNPYPVTISEVCVYVSGAAAAGGLLRLGLYNPSAAGFAVGTLLADLGQVDHSATGVKAITGLSVALPAGIFWCSYALQGTGAGGGTLGGAIPRVPVSWSVSTAHSQGNAQYQSGVTGAFGTFTYGGFAYGPLPVFEFKRSA